MNSTEFQERPEPQEPRPTDKSIAQGPIIMFWPDGLLFLRMVTGAILILAAVVLFSGTALSAAAGFRGLRLFGTFEVGIRQFAGERTLATHLQRLPSQNRAKSIVFETTFIGQKEHECHWGLLHRGMTRPRFHHLEQKTKFNLALLASVYRRHNDRRVFVNSQTA